MSQCIKNNNLNIPSSVSRSNDNEIRLTHELIQLLNNSEMGTYQEECTKRLEILENLMNLFHDWVKEVCLERNVSIDDISKYGHFYTFGSYRFGLISKESDIDTLCVVPSHFDRKDFFTSFVEILKTQTNMSNIICLEDAHVPLIKLICNGINVDILFARLHLPEIPQNLDLRNNRLLQNLDPRCIRSLNGLRVSIEFLHLVPNFNPFIIALRAIKFWAKQRGIYSSILGFLGGISWTILVAKTCQTCPFASPAELVHRFFQLFTTWIWPYPVLLNPLTENIICRGTPSWNSSINARDRFHLMPIITPCYPHQNSAFNVSKFTLDVMQREISRACKITTAIANNNDTWESLFAAQDFYSNYNYFLIVVAKASNEEEFKIWSGHVESKLRFLTLQLESKSGVILAHIDSKATPVYGYKFGKQWFIGLVYAKNEKGEEEEIDIKPDTQIFVNKVNCGTGIILKEGMTIDVLLHNTK